MAHLLYMASTQLCLSLTRSHCLFKISLLSQSLDFRRCNCFPASDILLYVVMVVKGDFPFQWVWDHIFCRSLRRMWPSNYGCWHGPLRQASFIWACRTLPSLPSSMRHCCLRRHYRCRHISCCHCSHRPCHRPCHHCPFVDCWRSHHRLVVVSWQILGSDLSGFSPWANPDFSKKNTKKSTATQQTMLQSIWILLTWLQPEMSGMLMA